MSDRMRLSAGEAQSERHLWASYKGPSKAEGILPWRYVESFRAIARKKPPKTTKLWLGLI